jgi:hypothetical protein
LSCDNANCITGDPAERQYAANKFYVVEDKGPRPVTLRCAYCEKDVGEHTATDFVVADTTRKTFSPDLAVLTHTTAEKLKHFVVYGSAADAAAAGFEPRDGNKRVRAG